MRSWLGVAVVIGLAACSFPTEGVRTDVIDASAAPDACVPTAEVCDGVDNDCDGVVDEGVASNAPCDGPDLDLCLDDMMICDADGNEVCGDTSGDDNPELCNGLDEDCDGEIDEGFAVGVACDGPDGDSCQEGVNVCAEDGLAVVCNDATDTIVETCNHADDDCDGEIDETFDFDSDANHCGDCGLTCTNAHGTTACAGGSCAPVCNNGAAQCNGNPDDGCELVDTNPVCTAGVTELSVAGDVDDAASTTGTTERFIRVLIRETLNTTLADIKARFTLTSGAGTNFDLYLYCGTCAATPRSGPGDVVDIGRSDGAMSQTFEVIAEVRYNSAVASTTCNPWTLLVSGNAAAVVVNDANRCSP